MDGDTLELLKRSYACLKKQSQRLTHPDRLSCGVKNIVALLTLFGAPWECMKAVITLKVGALKSARMSVAGITTEKLKSIAKEAIDKKPGLLAIAEDETNRLHLQVKKTWLRWCTAHWLFSQNLKGISVPSRLLALHYLSLWGHGPHQEQLSKHMDLFKVRSSTRKWMARFRKEWGFCYGKMPSKAPMDKAALARKATRTDAGIGPRPRQSFESDQGPHFRDQMWSPIWGPVVAHKAVPYVGMPWRECRGSKIGPKIWNHFSNQNRVQVRTRLGFWCGFGVPSGVPIIHPKTASVTR